MIENVPFILSYVVYGYVFLSAYYWISYKDNNDLNNIIIKSIIVSYILKTAYKLAYLRFSFQIESELLLVILAVILSACLGFLAGKIITTSWFNIILHRLHVGRTTNENIWTDVIKSGTWLRVYNRDGSSYLGQYRYGEPFQREPIIVLATWQKLDIHANVVLNYVESKDDFIMVNTKDFEKIEITYDKNYKTSLQRIREKLRELVKNKVVK